MACPKPIYRPRNARQSPLHILVRDHFAELKRVYPERFGERYGPWQPHWDKVIDAFLKCGDAHWGFARVRCTDCGDELILPFSCKARGFCPSCEAKRRAAWAEHLLDHVLPDLPYRMIVFTVPKCLRGIFMRERALLGELCASIARCAIVTDGKPRDFVRGYETTRDFLCAQFPRVEGVPYFISSIQTAGDQASIHLTGLAKMRDQERRDLEQSLETCADEGEAERMRRRLAEIGERER